MKRDFGVHLAALVLVSGVAASSHAALPGTIPVAPGSTVTPGLTVASAGTLLATLTEPFVASTGTSSGTLVTAVFRNSGGTLDFYYQLIASTTGTGCGGAQPPCDSIARLAASRFFGFATSVGFRLDGSALPGGVFVNGAVLPVSADRDSAGPAVSFSFFPPDAAKIHPGTVSAVLVISTDATTYTPGFCTVSDGGYSTVSAFAPAGHQLIVSGGSPSIAESAPFSGAVGTFIDTDTAALASNFTATIDWGDGSGTSAGTVSGGSGSFSVSGTHTFADEGVFSGTLEVDDSADTLTQTVPVTFTVTEADVLTGAGVDFNRAPGIPFSGTVATFTDTNPGNVAGDFTATIDWGDSHTTAGTVTGGSGAFAVSGTHTYTALGTFTVTTTLTDDAPGTAVGVATSTATIAPSDIPTLGGAGLAALIAAIALVGVKLSRSAG